MLFDLRGPGRRRTIKVVYVTLAFLMGGGLVLFGIGGGGVSGGLVDAITERRRQRHRRRALQRSASEAHRRGTRRTRRTPAPGPSSRARASTSPARARTSTRTAASTPRPARRSCARPAGVGGAPRARRREARFDRVASLMVQAYSALERARQGGARAGGHRRGPRLGGAYTQLAVLAYQAGQTRKGDLAKRQGARADRAGRARGAQGPARRRKAQAAAEAGQDAAHGPAATRRK